MRNWLWLCPSVMVGFAAAVLMVWGLSVWTSIIIALLLVCPVIILWGLIKTIRYPSNLPLEPFPKTRGMTLNWLAPFYDRWCPGIGLGLPFRLETLRHAALRSGDRVLDVGCGTGVLTRLAAETVGMTGEVIGVDPAPKMIAVARANATRAGSRAQFRPAVIEGLPFEDGRFDVVLSSLMLHHLPPDVKQAGVEEVYRVLKPGGRFVVVDFDCSQANPFYRFLGWPLRLIPMLRDHAAGRLEPYFRRAGFQPVKAAGPWGGFVGFYLASNP